MKEKLQWISGSPNSWRVMLFLEFKGINYQSIRIDPSKWDKDASGFFDLNPRGKVPVLQDGDFILYESLAIMSYIDNKYPEKKLFGNNSKEVGLISQRISELIHYGVEPMYLLSRNLMRGKAHEDILGCNETAHTIYAELEFIEKWFGSNSYLTGETLTAADIYFYPVIAFLERISTKQEEAKLLELRFLPLSKKFPKLKRWMNKIEDIPGFEKTIPPHWK